jgi:hypothetical protein
MLKDYNELKNERDSLDGNLNRMCVTDEESELESKHQWVLRRVQSIYEYNVARVSKSRENVPDGEFYCLVVGSRGFTDRGLMFHTLDYVLGDYLPRVTIVSGGAKGADSFAKEYADFRDLKYKEFPADWDRYGKSAGFRRNEEMHKFIAQYEYRGVVAFWDGSSAGTKHNFTLSSTYNNEMRTIVYTQPVHDVLPFANVAPAVEPKAPAPAVVKKKEVSEPVYSKEETEAIERLMSDLNESGIHILSIFSIKEWGMHKLAYVNLPYVEKSIELDDGEYYYYIYSMEHIDRDRIKRNSKKQKITKDIAIELTLAGLRH